MSSVWSDSRWTCRHIRSSMLQVDTCNYTCSKSHVQGNCGGWNSVPLCWRQGLCLHKPMPLTIVWWEVAAGPAIATSNRSVRQTISSLRKCVDQMNSNFLYMTQKYLDAVHKWSGQLGTLAHEFVVTQCVRCRSVNRGCCMWQDIWLLYQFPLSI